MPSCTPMELNNIDFNSTSLFGLFLMGLFYGFTVCSYSCFPVVATYVLGTKKTFKEGFYSCVIFSFARLFGYIIAGTISALGGILIKQLFNQNILTAISGFVFIIVGISLCLNKRTKSCCQNNSKPKQNIWQLIILGLTTGLMPCLPYMAVMSVAAASGSISYGILSTTMFGLGNIISPLLILSGAMGWIAGSIAKKIPEHRNILLKLNATFIILMGTNFVLKSFLV
ncbi:sulfite exporter TauE/SafE family protein [Lentisphaerota bacterium WC36G]|nr:sulfite exporter TauE/SafE family protein [Lentisphaerae bacterium WC36]